MIKKSVLALAVVSLLNFGVTGLQAVEKTCDTTYNCAKEQQYTVAPEVVATALTIGSGLIGSCTFTDKPDFSLGCLFGGLTAFMSAFVTAAKHDFADYMSAERRYYDRMIKAFATLVAPSVLAAGFVCSDKDTARGLMGSGLLGTIATALAWL